MGVLLEDFTLGKKCHGQSIRGGTPGCWIYVQDKRVKLGRIQIFNNWSPYLVQDARKYIWLGLEYFCGEDDECFQDSDEKWKELAVSELLQLDMIKSPDWVLDYHVERVEKAYPAYFDAYGQLPKLIEYVNRYENLYCVGRNGQHRYNNMEHSMLTAFRTAEHIRNHEQKGKDDIWQVNTEQVYHEE